jgi:hypothetical protein
MEYAIEIRSLSAAELDNVNGGGWVTPESRFLSNYNLHRNANLTNPAAIQVRGEFVGRPSGPTPPDLG